MCIVDAPTGFINEVRSNLVHRSSLYMERDLMNIDNLHIKNYHMRVRLAIFLNKIRIISSDDLQEINIIGWRRIIKVSQSYG